MSGYWSRNRCILSKFYIKPQRSKCYHVRWFCCILSKFYIKPQLPAPATLAATVVSYRNSTSNHNGSVGVINDAELYLIEILHQTTTYALDNQIKAMLYLIEILHQTTTIEDVAPIIYSCILSKFYIKPQRISIARS